MPPLRSQVHINLPHIGAVCRRLGVDYAPALNGFEIRAGRSVPSLVGVVVCAEHEEGVGAAYEEDLRQRAQQAQQKRMAAAEEAWRQLLRALLTRVRLQSAYGDNAPQEGQETAEGEAAAMLVSDAPSTLGGLPAVPFASLSLRSRSR